MEAAAAGVACASTTSAAAAREERRAASTTSIYRGVSPCALPAVEAAAAAAKVVAWLRTVNRWLLFADSFRARKAVDSAALATTGTQYGSRRG